MSESVSLRRALVASRASWPAMALSTLAQSCALRASTPAQSRLDANAIMPQRETRP